MDDPVIAHIILLVKSEFLCFILVVHCKVSSARAKVCIQLLISRRAVDRAK